MENLFLHTINELDGYVGYLMTDRFASHALRVLLVVLSGQELPGTTSSKGPLRSKSKEHVTVNGVDRRDLVLEQRKVPESFTAALEKLINESVSALDTTYLRALATHKIGNPVLQLLLQIELSHFGKQRAKDQGSLLHKLIPDETLEPESESAIFVSNLTYDAVGSRLVEAIVEYAPGKVFKTLYKQFFKERLPSLARNEIAGYVASKVLERLGRDDLEEAVTALIPEVNRLVDLNRTAVIRTAIERCGVRGIDTKDLSTAIEKAYSGPSGFDIARLLKLSESRQESASAEPQAPTSTPTAISSRPHGQSEKVHSSLLAQTMLSMPGPLSELLFDALLKLSHPLLLKMAHDAPTSRVIQASLLSKHATVIFRRKMIQSYYGQFGAMALDPSASRVLDAIWKGTQGLAFIRERIAEELAENEASLRESGVGRHVWRKWEMDLWRRRRGEWVARCRESVGNDGFVGFPENGIAPGDLARAARKKERMSSSASATTSPRPPAGVASGVSSQGKKTAIELARERHAEKKRKAGEAKANGKAAPPDAEGEASPADGIGLHKAVQAVEKRRVTNGNPTRVLDA